MINVCEQLRCPFYRRSGCDRYTVSNHCPVAVHLEQQVNELDWSNTDPREIWFQKKKTVDINQYAIYVNPFWIDVDMMTNIHKKEVMEDPNSIQRLKFKGVRDENRNQS